MEWHECTLTSNVSIYELFGEMLAIFPSQLNGRGFLFLLKLHHLSEKGIFQRNKSEAVFGHEVAENSQPS